MLMPEELSKYPNEIVKVYEQLEAQLIYDIVIGIQKVLKSKETQKLSVSSQSQIAALEEIGINIKEIKRSISKTTKVAIEDIDRIFNNANIKSFDREKTLFKLAGKTLVFSNVKLQILQNSIKNTQSEFLNFTKSFGMEGMPLEKFFKDCLNTSYLEIQSGAYDYNTSINRQIQRISKSGLELISYKSGRTEKVDVVVRRSVLDGLKSCTNRISELNALEMKCDGYEISAHSGARPEHQLWQGRQFAIAKNSSYPVYSEVVGNDMEDPNCRHTKWGIFLGITTPVYTKDQLLNIDPKPFKFKIGNKEYEYDAYKATQKQRSIERSIRETKRLITGYESSGSKSELNVAKAKLKNQMNLYVEFSKTANLLPQFERLGVIYAFK